MDYLKPMVGAADCVFPSVPCDPLKGFAPMRYQLKMTQYGVWMLSSSRRTAGWLGPSG